MGLNLFVFLTISFRLFSVARISALTVMVTSIARGSGLSFHLSCVLCQHFVLVAQSLVLFQGLDQFEFGVIELFLPEFVVELVLVDLPL